MSPKYMHTSIQGCVKKQKLRDLFYSAGAKVALLRVEIWIRRLVVNGPMVACPL